MKTNLTLNQGLLSNPSFKSNSKGIAYYISSHGYGHAARSVVLLKKLIENFNIYIKTEIPNTYFTSHLGASFFWSQQTVDIGCVQKNFIDLNVEQTFARYRAFVRDQENRLERE